jgi:hypothetical protein
MSSFQDAIPCVITGDDLQGKSVVIIDGGPSSELGSLASGGFLKFRKLRYRNNPACHTRLSRPLLSSF